MILIFVAGEPIVVLRDEAGTVYNALTSGQKKVDVIEVNSDIRNISGATLSSTHMAEGVKRVLAYHASHFH